MMVGFFMRSKSKCTLPHRLPMCLDIRPHNLTIRRDIIAQVMRATKNDQGNRAIGRQDVLYKGILPPFVHGLVIFHRAVVYRLA